VTAVKSRMATLVPEFPPGWKTNRDHVDGLIHMGRDPHGTEYLPRHYFPDDERTSRHADIDLRANLVTRDVAESISFIQEAFQERGRSLSRIQASACLWQPRVEESPCHEDTKRRFRAYYTIARRHAWLSDTFMNKFVKKADEDVAKLGRQLSSQRLSRYANLYHEISRAISSFQMLDSSNLNQRMREDWTRHKHVFAPHQSRPSFLNILIKLDSHVRDAVLMWMEIASYIEVFFQLIHEGNGITDNHGTIGHNYNLQAPAVYIS
jgi:hypothetical protein